MNWQDAMEIMVRRRGHERYRELCAEDYPDRAARDAYRRLLIKLASGELPAVDPATADLVAHLEKHGCC